MKYLFYCLIFLSLASQSQGTPGAEGAFMEDGLECKEQPPHFDYSIYQDCVDRELDFYGLSQDQVIAMKWERTKFKGSFSSIRVFLKSFSNETNIYSNHLFPGTIKFGARELAAYACRGNIGLRTFVIYVDPNGYAPFSHAFDLIDFLRKASRPGETAELFGEFYKVSVDVTSLPEPT